MFSSKHEQCWRQMLEYSARVGTAPVLKCPMEVEDFMQLLWLPEFGTGGELDKTIRAKSYELKTALHQGVVFAIAPIYVSSICSEHCLYCNFRAGNKGVEVVRKRLSFPELEKEASYLVQEKGLRVLELVYACDPLVRADAMCRHIELLKRVLEDHGGGVVGISAEALEEKEYRQLVAAGLDFSVLWQETYVRDRYAVLHPFKTRKADFDYRVDAYERMLSAGIRNIGMGVLSGLADWRQDWAMLAQHENYLRRTYGRGASILGIPRLKPAPGAILKESIATPNSRELLALIALHNILSPDTAAFVSTREDWNLCVELAQGGGCLFTFNCSTVPGGYTLSHDGCQFPAHSYDAVLYAPRLQACGVEPVLRWNFQSVSAGGYPAAGLPIAICAT